MLVPPPQLHPWVNPAGFGSLDRDREVDVEVAVVAALDIRGELERGDLELHA